MRLQSVLRFVKEAGEATRREVARATNLSPSVVIRAVGELLDLDLLINEDTARRRRRRGRPSDVLRLNASAVYGVGLEFGREHLVTVITDSLGEVVAWSTAADVPPFVADEATTRTLLAAVPAAVYDAGIDWERVDAVGLALHDIVNAAGEWVVKEHLHAPPFAIGSVFERTLGRPTCVEDVSRAFAEAEYRFGAGRHRSDMAYVFIGRHGVGSGVFVNGQLLKSSSGVCGEIGHIIVEDDGPLCQCGSRGCLETVASHDAVVGQMRTLLDRGVQVAIPAGEPVSFAGVCAAAGAGDKVSSMVLHRLAQNVGTAVASLINLTGTPHVVVGGQLALAGEVFLADLASAIRHRLITLLARDLTLTYAQLPANAGARGAAVQALEAAWSSGAVLSRARAKANGKRALTIVGASRTGGD